MVDGEKLKAHSSRLIASAALAAVVLISFFYQRATWLGVGLAAIAVMALVRAAGWWPRRWTLCAILAANVGLVFLYLWALDSYVHIVIRSSPGGYSATISDGLITAPLKLPVTPGRIGFLAGNSTEYRIGPAGEAGAASGDSLLAQFMNWMRFAAPRPAWTNVRVEYPDGESPDLHLSSRTDVPAANWSINRRGELEGSLGTYTLLGPTFPATYTLEADLARPDGTQGIIVGVDRGGNGYAFTPRMDQPDALWIKWEDGYDGAPVGGTRLTPSVLPSLRRLCLIFLPNVIVALLLLLLLAPVYAVFSWIATFGAKTRSIRSQEPSVWSRVAHPQLLDGVALVAGIAAVVLAAIFGTQQLERIPHVQDSVAYLFQARMFALGHFWMPEPRLSSFYREDFVLFYHGHWFSIYQPAWPLLLAVGVALHGAWLVNPLLAGADILLLYLIGREVYGRGIGILATLLLLSSPFFLFLAGEYMAHTCALFFTSGFAYLFILWVRRRGADGTPPQSEWRYLVPAGLLFGMAVLTRQLDAFFFAAPLLFLVDPRRWRSYVQSVGWIVLGGLGPAIFLLLYNWDITGTATTSPYTLWAPWNRFGWGKDIGFYGNFTPGEGLWNTSWNLQSLQAHLFGWPFYFTLALLLIPFLLGRANRWDIVFAASTLAIVIAYVAYWGAGVMYGPRYYYVALPWMCLLTARGLQELVRWPLRLPFPFPRDMYSAVAPVVLLGGLLLGCNLTVYVPTQLPMYKGYNFSSAAQLNVVSAAGVHHALVFVAHSDNGWFVYGIPFSQNPPDLKGDVIYARDEGAANVRLERRYPGREYYLLDGIRLTKLGV